MNFKFTTRGGRLKSLRTSDSKCMLFRLYLVLCFPGVYFKRYMFLYVVTLHLFVFFNILINTWIFNLACFIRS